MVVTAPLIENNGRKFVAFDTEAGFEAYNRGSTSGRGPGLSTDILAFTASPTAPPVSDTDQARLYYNSVADLLYLSVNGGAYAAFQAGNIEGAGAITQIPVFTDGDSVIGYAHLTYVAATKILSIGSAGAGGLALNDLTTAAYFTILKSNSSTALSANRILTFDVKNAARSLILGGNLTLTGALTMSGAFDLTLTLTAGTSVTLPITGTLATLAGAENFTNKTITAGAFATSMTLADAVDIILNATTGTKIGTAITQKLGFWNATPVVQPANANQAAVVTTGATLAAYGFTEAQANAIVTLLNAIRGVLVTEGLMKGAA